MTSEDIVKMAKEAGFGNYAYEARGVFERFANLIATKIGNQQYSLGYLDGNAAGIREGIETEREACAKVEAQQLADKLETSPLTFRDKTQAAAELRRLCAENKRLADLIKTLEAERRQAKEPTHA